MCLPPIILIRLIGKFVLQSTLKSTIFLIKKKFFASKLSLKLIKAAKNNSKNANFELKMSKRNIF